jgi:hypothetical protein
MKENVGRIDRIGRAVIGPALMALGYTRLRGRDGETAGLAAMIVGAMLIDSAITRVCPGNALLGIDTRTKRERERDLQSLLRASDRDMAFTGRASAGSSATSLVR